MQISLFVPYDESRLRRTLQFILRPQLKRVRILGGVLTVVGLALVALEPSEPVAYVALVLGLVFVTAIGRITVARAMRTQSDLVKNGHHMTLDDEWVAVIHPLVESRLRWAAGRVIETPEVWYVMFGKIQAVTIPKSVMTEQQSAEFAAFIAGAQTATK